LSNAVIRRTWKDRNTWVKQHVICGCNINFNELVIYRLINEVAIKIRSDREAEGADCPGRQTGGGGRNDGEI